MVPTLETRNGKLEIINIFSLLSIKQVLSKILKRGMPNFKPKYIKKIKFNKKTAVTLDTKHKEFLTEFTNDETDVIPELKAERRELKTKLLNEYDELTLEGRIDLEDKVAEITARIREINAKKKEYFLDNSKFIFEYFENIAFNIRKSRHFVFFCLSFYWKLI